MYTVEWNTNWDTITQDALPSGFSFFKQDTIRPFIEAVQERAYAAGILLNNGIYPSGEPISYLPSSGYPCLKTNYNVFSNPSLDDAHIKSSAHLYPPTIFNPTPFSGIPCSGVSWADLQTYTCVLSRYFVNKDFDLEATLSIPSGQQILYTPSGVFHKTVMYPSSKYGPPNEYLNDERSNVNGIVPKVNLYNTNLATETYLDHKYNFPLDHYNDRYVPEVGSGHCIRVYDRAYSEQSYPSGCFYGQFPSPSGFRRKYPRHIYDLRNPGVSGQKALFAYKGYGLPWTYDDPTSSGFGRYVDTPLEQKKYSGHVLQYTSGWQMSIELWPDIVGTSGTICHGDYFGPWILEDIKNALNQMVRTYAVTSPYYGVALDTFYSSGTLPSAYIWPASGEKIDYQEQVIANEYDYGFMTWHDVSGIIPHITYTSSIDNNIYNNSPNVDRSYNSPIMLSGVGMPCSVAIAVNDGISLTYDKYGRGWYITNVPTKQYTRTKTEYALLYCPHTSGAYSLLKPSFSRRIKVYQYTTNFNTWYVNDSSYLGRFHLCLSGVYNAYSDTSADFTPHQVPSYINSSCSLYDRTITPSKIYDQTKPYNEIVKFIAGASSSGMLDLPKEAESGTYTVVEYPSNHDGTLNEKYYDTYPNNNVYGYLTLGLVAVMDWDIDGGFAYTSASV